MTFNKKIDRLESGTSTPESPNDEVIWVDTNNNSIKRYNETNDSWVSVGGAGGAANTGDITFDGVKIIGAGAASGDGLSNSTMQIVPDADLYANDQYLIIDPTNPNHIHIRAGGTQDESIADLILGGERNNVYIEDDARKVSISTRNALIENSYTNLSASTSTNFITSNASDINTDYIVTVGGSAYLVNSVTSNAPSAGSLTVTATGAVFAPGQQYTFTYDPPYNSYWEFTSNGYLLGPAMGGLFVSGILNGDNNLWLSSSHDVVISSGNGNGVFLENESIADNQVATLGDLPSGATGTFETSDSKLVTVTNGIITAINPL